MQSTRISKLILSGESIGFFLLVCLIWLDELYDFPHKLLGQKPALPNIPEALLESGVVIVLGIAVITLTAKLLKKIKILEGFLSICSFCKRIRHDGKWTPIESYVHERSMADFTHGLCPDCAKEHYGMEIENED
ncbi:MAG: hypothetical protein GF418_14210 [Chitinivibrionales bacterium]|nr:hypothetical protein [Chitinivibrionales bacterium]MBD3396773.1 hypothetical protein [Chitinivibrionales bacterium]